MTTNTPQYATQRPWRQKWWAWGLIAIIGIVVIASAASTPPREGMSQERLDSLARQLKCMQCAGENAADSRTTIAIKFREEIGEQMAAGQTDDEILNFFADSYGPEVLLSPPSAGLGIVVWLLPVLAVAGAIFGLSMTFFRWRDKRVVSTVSDEDRDLVAQALHTHHDQSLNGESHPGTTERPQNQQGT